MQAYALFQKTKKLRFFINIGKKSNCRSAQISERIFFIGKFLSEKKDFYKGKNLSWQEQCQIQMISFYFFDDCLYKSIFFKFENNFLIAEFRQKFKALNFKISMSRKQCILHDYFFQPYQTSALIFIYFCIIKN